MRRLALLSFCFASSLGCSLDTVGSGDETVLADSAGDSLVTVDVSFISLTKVLAALARCLAPESPGAGERAEATIVALVKPQFELGRSLVGKGGVVRDPGLHAAAVQTVAAAARALGLSPVGVVASPLRGPKGNREFFLHLVARTGTP